MHRSAHWIHLLPFTLAVACAQRPPSGGGQSGEEWDDTEALAGCEEVSRSPVADDEAAPNGVVPADVIDVVNGVFGVDLRYADASLTRLSLGLTTSGGAEWVDLEPTSSGDGAEIAMESWCEDELRFALQVDFQTEDGQFSERLSPELTVGNDGVGSWWAPLEIDALVGAWSPSPARDGFDPAEWDEVRLALSGQKGLGDPSGRVEATASRVDGDGPDGTASAASFEVASYGPLSER
jgi:hypothetical protein